MAVYNNYVDANLVLGKITEAPFAQGSKVFSVVQSFVVAAADSASSIYRVFPGIPSDAIIISIKILNDALPGVTAAVVGLYNCLNFDGVGAVINAGAELNAGIDISAGNAIGSNWKELYLAPSIANREKCLWELAGQTQYPGPIASPTGPKPSAYDICLTCPGMTTNTANVSMKLVYTRDV
jgi:hypothetical protein